MADASNEERSYIAFISYRHQPLDREAAERVQKKIENYVIPKEYREKAGGKKLGICFRDEDELPASSSLTDSIYYALDHARFLIVICTPDLPLSKWCEAEIKYFLKTHDRDHILAVLTDGDPEESFSPYMLHDFDDDGNIVRDWEPLAANIAGENHTINNKAFKKEIVRIFAALIGCPFDSLWQREKRARTNRLLSLAGAAVAVLAVFLGVVVNRNAKIEEQNVQITAQNDQITEQYDQITEQYDQITEQKGQIEEQNTRLQKQLSTVLVDSGLTNLSNHDTNAALSDALSAVESGDPGLYDPRSEKLFADALGAYQTRLLRCEAVYRQSTDITRICVTDDESHAYLLDSAGVIRCLDPADYTVLWEVKTGDKETGIFTQNFSDRLLYKSHEGLYCLSAADGSEIWSYEHTEYCGNLFLKISEDNSTAVILDSPGKESVTEDTPFSLCFLDTENGELLGSCELQSGNCIISSLSIYEEYDFGGAFSPDNSSFVAVVPAVSKEDNTEFFSLFFKADLKTFAACEPICSYTPSFDRICDIELGEDGSVFFAGISSSTASLFTALGTAKEDGSYDFSNELYSSHRVSMIGGFDYGDDIYRTNERSVLKDGDTRYIFSDNQMFVFNCSENRRRQIYSLSGKIINAWWIDPDKHRAEVVCSDGYYISYVFGENNTVVSSMYGEDIGQGNLILTCPLKGGFHNDPESGSVLAVSSDYPGTLLRVGYISDPHRTEVDLRSDDFSSGSGLTFQSGVENGLFRYLDSEYNNLFATFNKKTGEIQKNVSFEKFYADDVMLLDNESFLAGSCIYHMDGTSEYYAEPASMTYYPNWNLRLNSGSILSWGYSKSFYDKGSGLNLYLHPLWLDGKLIPGTDDPAKGLLFSMNAEENYPMINAGKTGLVMLRCHPVEYDTKELIYGDQPALLFMNAETGTITSMEDPCPQSDTIKTAFANSNLWMAAFWEDGSVRIFDPENKAVTIPNRTWSAGEIAALCFSPDDAYLLLLTVNGELDIIDTKTMEPVYEETIGYYSNLVRNRSYSFYGLTVESISDSGYWLITATGSSGHAILFNPETLTVAADIGTVSGYDSDNGRIWTSSGTKDLFRTFPIYDLQSLEDWAREKLGE